MAVNTRIQFRRGSTNDWTSSVTGIGQGILYQGELGFETTTGRFKIGNGTSHWNALPYAGGSDLVHGTGVALIFDSTNNKYTIHSRIENSGVGISLSEIIYNGDGTSTPKGSGFRIGLSDRLQAVSNLNTSGIIVSTNSTGVVTRSLSSGANISISNADGILGNPSISLNSSLTGLSSISGNNNFRISSNSGISINAGAGEVWVDDLGVSGTLYVGGNIDISLAATILARGPIIYSGNPTVFSGSVYYSQTPYVGPTGGTLGVNLFPVSLSGHNHTYSDITNFCSGVASCVDTSLTAGTGMQFIYNSGTDNLAVSLTGQALALHTFTDTGLMVRTGSSTFSGITITASGTNIWIGNGDGVSANPSVGLNPNVAISSLGVTNNVDITGNLIIGGNLTVNGDTVVTNVATVQVEDPVIRIGGTGTLSNSDNKDRGIEFIYQTGNGVPITGFFGFDYSAGAFTLLTNTNNSSEIYTGGTSGLLNVGGLFSSGGISGTVLTSTIASPSAPISVTSTGQVNNLNSDYLDGQHGSYYLNSANLTGTINNSVLPLASTTNSGIVRFDADNFIFNTNGIVSAKNIVYTTGVQTVSGVKTFANIATLASGATISGTTSIVAASSSNATTYFPVFTGSDPGLTSQPILNRTLANVRSDLGSSSNTLQTLVLRDNSNGGFTAGTITATGFVGYGGGITGLDANNLSSGVVPTGRLSGTYNINVTGSAASTTGSLTFKTDGLGATGVSFNGSINRDISYNSIGAPSQTGALASGTQWNISILGNAATVTNGVTTSRSINTTSGITGGGNLGSDLTLGAVAGTGIVVNSVGIHVNTTSVVMATSGSSQTVSGVKTFENRPVLNSGLSIKNTTTTSVSGFAVFSGDPTAGTAFTVDYRSIGNIRSDLGTSSNTSDRLVLRDASGNFSAGNISGTDLYASNQTANRVAVFDANKMLFSTGVLTSELTHLTGITGSIQNQLNSKAASGVSLTAGNGLTGGGSLSGNLSFDVGAGDGISVGTDAVNVDSTVVRTSGSQTISGIKTFTNAIVFQSGLTSSGTLSAQSAASAGPNSFAVFDSSPTGSSVALSSRTLSSVRSDLGTSTNTADRLVLRDSNGDFASRYISVTGISGVQAVGSMTSVYTSTSISGLNNTTYLANFIIDGGTP